MKPLILIVEDNNDILLNIKLTLEFNGFEVITATNGKEGLKVLSEQKNLPEIIVSDIMMPEMDGYDFFQAVSNNPRWSSIPFLFLTARSSVEDIRFGKMLGVDDYLTKPFNMKELILRVKAILRRISNKIEDGTLSYRDIILDKSSRTLSVDGKNIDITKLEFNLLCEFVLNKGNVLERDYLLENVWNDGEEYQYRTVNVAINRLKEKIDPDKTKDYIQTVRGIGYKLC
ncbi:MAG: response regulator transcription factor [Sulfurimonas sp.]|nr:response regulator transcription factor [Sulfurimonas sp.]